MSRKSLMAAAAAVMVIGSATVVALGPAGLAPWSRPVTTTDPSTPPSAIVDQVSTDSGSGPAPKTPGSTTAPTTPAQVANEIAAGQGQRAQLRQELQLSEADARSATTRGKIEHFSTSAPAASPQPYDTVV